MGGERQGRPDGYVRTCEETVQLVSVATLVCGGTLLEFLTLSLQLSCCAGGSGGRPPSGWAMLADGHSRWWLHLSQKEWVAIDFTSNL